MSTLVKRPLSFVVTLILKDGRQFIISDIKYFHSWNHSNPILSRLELEFYEGTSIEVCFSKIDRFNISVARDIEVIPFDMEYNDYDVREFADHFNIF